MKHICRYLLFTWLCFTAFGTFAQGNYTLSGRVVNEGNKPQRGVTVFISGSTKKTATNDDGVFVLDNMDQGTFQLSATMIGYAPYAQNVLIRGKSVVVNIVLKTKSIILDQVVIGDKATWEKNFDFFRQIFLGTSDNAKECVIVNPKVINFSTKKNYLFADADDFLIIENKKLGYRINYLLKSFGYDRRLDVALYDGETNFEEMDGTPKQKKQWDKNRLNTYKGSLMHFLRSVYANDVLTEGFIVNPLLRKFYVRKDLDMVPQALIDDRTIKFDSLVTAVDTSLKSFKFNLLYVNYDPKQARRTKTNSAYPIRKEIKLTDKVTTIKPFLKEALIDRRGNHVDYRDFFIEGEMGKKRVGDQLPLEYQPPKS